jgi:integrase
LATVRLLGSNEIESFFATQAAKYSRSTIRSMRISLGLLLSYAVRNGWLKEDLSRGVKLPRAENCAGRRVQRNVLSPSQTTSIAEKLSEPYATLVLFLAVTGLRIGEAIAIKWSDFEGDVLHVQRRLYEGKVDSTKSRDSERRIPIPAALLERLKALGESGEWIFHARGGVPLNPAQCDEALCPPGGKGTQDRLGWVARLSPHSGNIDVARRPRCESCVGVTRSLRCCDHASHLRPRKV